MSRPFLPQMSPGSEADGRAMIMDEKKRKRMQSNRESARRSRMKKQKLQADLVTEVTFLEVEIRKNRDNYEVLMQKTLVLESENNILKAQQMELAQYLRKLELMQTHMEVFQMRLMQPGNSSSHQTLDIKEQHLESWQCYGSKQPIMASAGMFNY